MVRRIKVVGVLIVIAVVTSACGGGKAIGGGATSSSAPGPTSTAATDCHGARLTASEVGVTPTTITVSVVADTGSPLRPGLFQGVVDGVHAWANYLNANGGLACRQVLVRALDSHLTADDAHNSITTACGNSLALVGTSAVFLDNMTPAEQCKNQAGEAVGIPDLALLQTYSSQQCSPVSYAVLPSGAACPYGGTGVRTFSLSSTAQDYYFSKYGRHALHGVYLVPSDLPSAISVTTPLFAADKRLGITADAEFGISQIVGQSGYTSDIQAIKSHKATFARDGGDYVSNVFMRREAQVQGVDSVKVWDCTVQCYDRRLISTGGSAVEGQYAWVSFLPFEDKGHNTELDNFLQYDKHPDGFGAQGWIAGQAFAAAVDAVVAKAGPNGITREAVLGAIRRLTNFDDNGFMAPTDIGHRVESKCVVGMQVQHGAFVRVDPSVPGTFDCRGRTITFRLDAVKAYKG
jgi:hypothetical protein